MDRLHEHIAECRAQTDASIGAERASTDAVTARVAAAAQRVADDLIERDRVAADERLCKFRERADSVFARDRASSHETSVSAERRLADEGKRAEREVTDALLERERERADSIIEAERQEHETVFARLEACREDTDVQLSVERTGADVAVNALDETTKALTHAQSEQARRADVLGMVAHDLRSPLSVILMSAQCIADGTGDMTSVGEAAHEVTRAAARMNRLLTDLLDVARIESGTFGIVKRRHDVGALVHEVHKSYRPLFADRGIAFTVEGPALVIFASFDHDRIVQVLSNLLGNAMKFTPPGGAVGLRVERSGQHVEFVLRDSGSGIHADAVPHVFERFWQFDRVARRGLGLGLYICRKVIEAHGGRIWAESRLGEGATFRFTLPAS